MPAVDNKHMIEIFSINLQEGVSSKNGKPYKIHKAQCLVSGPDGATQIGELNLPKELAEATTPGKYLAEFELGVSYERLVIPRITALHPFGSGARPTPQPVKA